MYHGGCSVFLIKVNIAVFAVIEKAKTVIRVQESRRLLKQNCILLSLVMLSMDREQLNF